MPLLICRLFVKLNRFLWFQTLEALLGPAEVIVPLAMVVTPPPMTIPPGPAPDTNESLEENEAWGAESLAKPAREKPAVKLLRTRGDRICVSCKLITWRRSARADANSGFANGIRPLP